MFSRQLIARATVGQTNSIYALYKNSLFKKSILLLSIKRIEIGDILIHVNLYNRKLYRFYNIMKKFKEDFSTIKKEINISLIILIAFLIITGLYIYNNRYFVIVRFDELGPLTKNMTAYYNGFKIGKIGDISPDIDFKHILVKINLTQKNLNLPQNTLVYVERFPNGELYLQFAYPQSPALRPIKRGDILEGIAPYNIEQFMMGQNVSGMSDIVSLHIIKALNSADAANQEMKVFFHIATKIIKENDKEIRASINNTKVMTENLATMAKNLNQTSQKLNNAIIEGTIRDTTSNIKDTTENISKATKDLDKTMKKVDDTITQANEISENLNSITGGLNDTLSKRFGGMRIMFGTTVKSKN